MPITLFLFVIISFAIFLAIIKEVCVPAVARGSPYSKATSPFSQYFLFSSSVPLACSKCIHSIPIFFFKVVSSKDVPLLKCTPRHHLGETTPMRDHPMRDHPGETTPMRDHPMRDHPGETTPMRDHPMRDHPGETTPMRDHPMRDHPGETTPMRDHPMRDYPGETTPMRDHPGETILMTDHHGKTTPMRDHTDIRPP